jgi:hypothetical protein
MIRTCRCPCFHKENLQLVPLHLSVFQKLGEAWEERYASATGSTYSAASTPPPSAPREWAEWQITHNALTEEDRDVLEKIKATDSFDDIPPEWEYWFSRKLKGESCIGLDMVDVPQESKRVGAATLKAVEAVILFENHRVMQLGYVLNWDRFNSVETVAEQVRRQGLAVQLIPVLPRDYNRFLEEQVNKTIQLSKFISRTMSFPTVSLTASTPLNSPTSNSIRKRQGQADCRGRYLRCHKRGASDILVELQINDYWIRPLTASTRPSMGCPSTDPIIVLYPRCAGMNITEKRLPQDGKITLNIRGTPVEIRAATMPVLDSQEEKITLRLLSSIVRFPNLDKLGMRQGHLQLVRKALSMVNGIIIVTGPTGSGKTTTLYSAIQEMDRERLNVCSLEDPIETYIPGISQTQVNEIIGLTFARGLRALLRQAPHVILLGEIRDREVAQIAVQAANTGHLVLTTLHTNSASGTFDRLQALDVEAHQIADAVRLILAQRLIPRLCPVCRKNRRHAELEMVRIEKQSGMR